MHILKKLGVIFTLFVGISAVHAEDVKILYISSLPEIIKSKSDYNLAQIATAVRAARENSENVIFVHGGASLGPSVLGALDHGAHMIDILNIIEPDIMGVGKREFSYKENQFSLHAQSAMFPFVSSNIQLKEKNTSIDGLEQYYVVDTASHSVGFVGVTSENAISEYGADQLVSLPMAETLRKNTALMREEGADVIVLLADTDFDDLSHFITDGTVDIILYAHNTDNPVSVDTGTETLTEGMLNGKLISVDVSIDENGNVSATPEAIPINSFEEDEEIKELVASYADRLDILFKQTLGRTDTPLVTHRNTVRTGENAFGNFVADSIRNAMRADIAFINSGGIRGDTTYAAGTVLTREHIQSELPFNNTVQLFEMTGAQLKGALEHGLSCLDELDGCFLQVSNIKMTYNSAFPKGQRVISVDIQGQKLNPIKKYKVATLNFLASGGDGFVMLKGTPSISNLVSGKLLWEVVADELAQKAAISPQIENRLVDEKNDGSAS